MQDDFGRNNRVRDLWALETPYVPVVVKKSDLHYPYILIKNHIFQTY
jgi:hypothetical protein